MQKKDTVVFDLDGTLLDTLEDLKNSVNYALEQFGYPTHTLEDIRRFVGNGITRLMELALPSGQDNPDFDAVLECFKKHYGIHCNDLTKPYDGIMELLHELKERGIKMAIVSNKADFAVKELNDIYFQEVIPLAVGERESEGIPQEARAGYCAGSAQTAGEYHRTGRLCGRFRGGSCHSQKLRYGLHLM